MSDPRDRKTNVNKRSAHDQLRQLDSGPYLARVVSHLDNKFMGSLKVQLIKTMTAGDQRDVDTNLITAFYASPFYGVTSFFGLGQNDNYQSTQKSYGFWAVPPDVDTKVLVTFVEGRRDICFWFACVPDDYMNFTIPDGRPATVLTSAGSRPQDFAGKKLPVGEYNKRIINTEGNNAPTTYVKPVNDDFASILTEQGLLEDDFRGLTTSSARREVPSAVFGINTPGPLDKRPGAPIAPRGIEGSKANVYWSRLGGHSIVMDDGDDKILRIGSPADSPPKYTSIETEGFAPQGAETRPANELFRIRTRTGHQILLHNTEDLIYIANARGTAWIELTSNGKIDIYAQDSVSIHTEGEFNVTADKNINLTSGGNINLNANIDIKNTSRNLDVIAGGRVAVKAAEEYSVESGDFIVFKASDNIGLNAVAGKVNVTGNNGVEINGDNDINLISDSGSIRSTAATNIEMSAKKDILLYAQEIHDASDKRFIDTETLHLLCIDNLFITTKNMDIASDIYKLESKTSIDVSSDGTIITVSNDESIKFKANLLFEVGSENLSVRESRLDFNGDGYFDGTLNSDHLRSQTIQTNQINAGISLANHVLGSGSAPDVVYNKHDPGDALTPDNATESNVPTPPTKTDGPETVIPSPAARTSRVPQHEPWYQHENLNPLLYANTESNNESLDTFVYPLPDPFTLFRSSIIVPISQTPSPGSNSGSNPYDEIEENSIGTINFNEYTDNAAAVIAFFESNGFETWVGAGIAGALQWESGKGINPGAYLAPNDKSDGLLNIRGNLGLGARGIAQWRDAGRRLTLIEQYIGKPILIQPEMNVFAPNYKNLRLERLPTKSYRSMVLDRGIRIADVSATLEEQLNAILWEFNNSEIATRDAILSVNSGSEVNRAARVAEIMNDLYLRSGNPTIPITSNTRIPIKSLRADSAIALYEAKVSGRSTAPVTDPTTFRFPSVVSSDPAANSRPRDAADPADQTTGSNYNNIISGSAYARQGPIRRNLAMALGKAARDVGIDRILGTSFGNECLRRINTSINLPLSTWGTFPSRADNPGRDMRYVGNDTWEKLNPDNGEYELRSNQASWRVGTERHDTGLALDCALQVRRNGNLVTLLPTNPSDKNKIIEFLIAFARYGGRGVGVGGNGSRAMPNGLFHLDLLGGIIENSSQFVRPSGYSGAPIIGWNQQPSAWNYGGASFNWALEALTIGYREVQ